MPRVATTSTSRSHKLADGKMPPSPPRRVRCPESSCPWSFKNQTDLSRHMPRHMSPEERKKQMYKCPQPGCTHRSLQKSNLQTHYNAKHSGLKPHVCKKCAYCVADPSCLHKDMVAVHQYIPGTTPRKCRSAASLIPAADASTVPSLVLLALDLFAFLPSPSPSTDFSLPASPNSWIWNTHFEEAFFPTLTCETSPVIELTPSLEQVAIHYPAEGIDFFMVGCDNSFHVEQHQQPLFDDSLVFFLPPPMASTAYGLETFSSCGLEDVIVSPAPAVFVSEWNGALH
ncbi:hypothetical protein DFH08DRAFT_950115 [Mycena albidolilacea]|uniref:C2H2-type domain-containing protein n=1 Tax=Mycena albidolilacea TaxID=1033008 RepID=A0AAD7APK7_9AGAR|nr:hypothetical protein DFH08DRAFT_950115 [Mycena albidolilacea]